MDRPTIQALTTLCGISPGTACDILNGKRRPSPTLAIHIFRRTGWKHDLIAHLGDDQIAMVEGVVGPWIPRWSRSDKPVMRAA